MRHLAAEFSPIPHDSAVQIPRDPIHEDGDNLWICYYKKSQFIV